MKESCSYKDLKKTQQQLTWMVDRSCLVATISYLGADTLRTPPVAAVAVEFRICFGYQIRISEQFGVSELQNFSQPTQKPVNSLETETETETEIKISS